MWTPTRIAVCLLFCVAVAAQTPRPVNPALVPVPDEPGLPRVLLIGDSISIGYTLPVRSLLKGVADIYRPPTNCGSTKKGLEGLDQWLGDGKWDVIHFNFGLHDCFVEDEKHPVPTQEYEKNLRQIVARLKKTGAKLIWASTTPMYGEGLLRPRNRKPRTHCSEGLPARWRPGGFSLVSV